MFKALNYQRRVFRPDAAVAKAVEGLELAMRMLFELSQCRSKPWPPRELGEGHSHPPRHRPREQSAAGTPGNLPTNLPWWCGTERGTRSSFHSIQRQNCQKLAPKCSYYVGESLGEKMRKEENYAIENMYESRQNNEAQTRDSALNGNCILPCFVV